MLNGTLHVVHAHVVEEPDRQVGQELPVLRPGRTTREAAVVADQDVVRFAGLTQMACTSSCVAAIGRHRLAAVDASGAADAAVVDDLGIVRVDGAG
jgi:hypothetical protein